MSNTILILITLLAVLAGCSSKKKICVPEHRRCDNNVVEQCNTDGKAWVFYRDCGSQTCRNGDCVVVPASCGQGGCEPTQGETCSTCPEDCGPCCGNGACEESYFESYLNCPKDCPRAPPDQGQVDRDGGAGDSAGADTVTPGTCTAGSTQCSQDGFGMHMCGFDGKATSFGPRIPCDPSDSCASNVCQNSDCNQPEVVLVLDRSSSMLKSNRWSWVSTALQDVVKAQQSTVHFGIRHFPTTGCQVSTPVPPTLNASSAVAQQVVPPTTNASTPLSQALTGLSGVFGDPDADQAVVLITDGDETCATSKQAVEAASALFRAGIYVHAIGVTSQANLTLLSSIATAGGTKAVTVNDGPSLKQALKAVLAFHNTCCLSQCAGKACGAPDGCGNVCPSGSCPPNATCQAGKCLCDHLACGLSCCTLGQVCKGSACCTPTCGSRVCGPDPVCGTSCGTCKSGQTCTSIGTCKYPCTNVAPLVVDSSGSVGWDSSLAVDGKGKVHISYHHFHFNAPSNKGQLRYATDASGSWVTTVLDTGYGGSGDVGSYSSLALDANDKVHISYYDDPHLGYTTNAAGWWLHPAVDSTSAVGKYTSLGLDAKGGVHISYFDNNNTDLKYATNSSSAWVDFTLNSYGSVGWGTSLTVDGAGNVHIGYNDNTNADLRYTTNASGSWVTVAVDSNAGVGSDRSLALDAKGNVHISYYDYNNKDLKYATNASGTWKTSTVDTNGSVGSNAALALDANDKVHISYYDETNGDLKYATNASGTWATFTVDSTGDVGADTSLALDAKGKIHISYFDKTNKDLKYAPLCPKWP